MDDGRIRRVARPDGTVAEIVVAAPIAELRFGAKTMDVLAAELEREFAPPTPEETAQAALAIAAESGVEVEKLRVTASTIATLAIAMARRLVDLGQGLDAESLLLSRSECEWARGGKIGMRETADHDVILRFRPRGELPIQPEEMRLDG